MWIKLPSLGEECQACWRRGIRRGESVKWRRREGGQVGKEVRQHLESTESRVAGVEIDINIHHFSAVCVYERTVSEAEEVETSEGKITRRGWR